MSMSVRIVVSPMTRAIPELFHSAPRSLSSALFASSSSLPIFFVIRVHQGTAVENQRVTRKRMLAGFLYKRQKGQWCNGSFKIQGVKTSVVARMETGSRARLAILDGHSKADELCEAKEKEA